MGTFAVHVIMSHIPVIFLFTVMLPCGDYNDQMASPLGMKQLFSSVLVEHIVVYSRTLQTFYGHLFKSLIPGDLHLQALFIPGQRLNCVV